MTAISGRHWGRILEKALFIWGLAKELVSKETAALKQPLIGGCVESVKERERES